MKSKIPRTNTGEMPLSWTFKTWPREVYPHEGTKARHLCRQHQSAMVACGALSRPSAEIVIIGAGYQRWLESTRNVDRVINFDVPANRPEHAAKRWGRSREVA